MFKPSSMEFEGKEKNNKNIYFKLWYGFLGSLISYGWYRDKETAFFQFPIW